MCAIALPADVVARFEALDAAVAGLREVNFDTLDLTIRLRAHQRLETSRRLQAVVILDIIHSLAQEEISALGGAPHQVIADWSRLSYAEARRRIRDAAQLAPRVTMTGEQLPPELPATARQWRDGMLDPEHLKVIQRFVEGVPQDLPPAVVEDAEEALAFQATQLRPDQLDKVAKRMACYLNPDGKFSDSDRARKRGFTWKPQSADGMSEGTLIATPELRAKLDAWLAKFAAPGMANPADTNPFVDAEPTDQAAAADTRTPRQRQHDALNLLVTSQLGNPALGQQNGMPVTVVVSTTLRELTDAAGHGVTASGVQLPMRDLIRMSRDAYHYLAVFDDHSNRPLYLGRSRRIATTDQRLTLFAAERGCTFPGCDVTADKCEVHHIDEWAAGGRTDVDRMTLACGPNHKLLNHGWKTSKRRDNRTAWTPPPHLDRNQPRSNSYHHPERLLRDNDDERAGP
ncbi:HNH endonuclease signature motif containing protein [Mycobacterium vicinigordonae]|uniref:HNH endonuclease n=1 Tax=Mycobacterium vicinigordonae TaxID=1719132 RepID=A0A7D6E1C1_9MYCO|nr:HNH endonuclease signature motif containing protein [Mycobacterium vicinigordonae]QLL09308.1 HNH endonuclease [Mycobacterium vicinigordonae]